jgi:hypothetical protein
MTTPAKLNFKLYQGSTFNETLRWESSVKSYKTITGITKSAPVVVTSPNHGIPLEWRVRFTNILGMTDLNNAETYYRVTSTTTNTVTISDINSLGYKDYISGGVIEYMTPIDLTGFTARMQIRGTINDSAIIKELTTGNGGIVLNNTTKTIVLSIPADITAAYTWNSAVYGLEMTSAGGQVTPLCYGTITLVKDVIR